MFVGWKRGRILRDEKAAVWSRWLLSWWVERRQYNNHWRFCFGPLALPPSIQPAAFFFFRYVYLRVGNPPRTRLVVVLCSVRSIPHQRLCQQRQRFFLLHRNHYHRLLLWFLSSKKKRMLLSRSALEGRRRRTNQPVSIHHVVATTPKERTNGSVACVSLFPLILPDFLPIVVVSLVFYYPFSIFLFFFLLFVRRVCRR